jgi:hypothetical protein
VDSSSSPRLENVLSLLRPMGLGLAVAPLVQKEPSQDDVVVAWLAHYGAPLYEEADRGNPRTPETALTDGLVLARRSGSVARALPCAFWACRETLNVPLLQKESERRGQGRSLGFFLDLVQKLVGKKWQPFDEAVSILRARHSPTPLLSRPSQFFSPTSKRERALADVCSSEVARSWGFRMNMDFECFASMFRKAMS